MINEEEKLNSTSSEESDESESVEKKEQKKKEAEEAKAKEAKKKKEQERAAQKAAKDAKAAKKKALGGKKETPLASKKPSNSPGVSVSKTGSLGVTEKYVIPRRKLAFSTKASGKPRVSIKSNTKPSSSESSSLSESSADEFDVEMDDNDDTVTMSKAKFKALMKKKKKASDLTAVMNQMIKHNAEQTNKLIAGQMKASEAIASGIKSFGEAVQASNASDSSNEYSKYRPREVYSHITKIVAGEDNMKNSLHVARFMPSPSDVDELAKLMPLKVEPTRTNYQLDK